MNEYSTRLNFLYFINNIHHQALSLSWTDSMNERQLNQNIDVHQLDLKSDKLRRMYRCKKKKN
jgi:hypothetical protein